MSREAKERGHSKCPLAFVVDDVVVFVATVLVGIAKNDRAKKILSFFSAHLLNSGTNFYDVLHKRYGA